jgi:hypothetical protein
MNSQKLISLQPKRSGFFLRPLAKVFYDMIKGYPFLGVATTVMKKRSLCYDDGAATLTRARPL